MSQPPYSGLRIIELSKTLTGRLTGLMFADQGAEVLIERDLSFQPNEHDGYFDRNKISVPPGSLEDTDSADVIIVDGDKKINSRVSQIVLHVTAALPDDEIYGDLEADCSEDLLNALVGFFTDMSTTGKFIGRPVIYTPLPLCSVYAGVTGAIAVAAALVDRTRCGKGREITSSRIAGGLSAIGALSLITKGEPEHLKPADLTGLPEDVDPEAAKKVLKDAATDPAKQLWLEQRLIPLNAPYVASDGRFIMAIAGVNRRLAQRFCQTIGIWDQVMQSGMVDVNPYDPQNLKYRGRNIADAGSLDFNMNKLLADLITPIMAQKTALEWEKELCNDGIPAVMIRSFDEWMKDSEARHAALTVHIDVLKQVQLGRTAWLESAQPYDDLKACKQIDFVPERTEMMIKETEHTVTPRPLEGFVLVDFANVIAGPNCGRIFSELGATVYKVDPVNPQHAPVVMVTWAAEHGVGKQSIILDIKTDKGKEIMNKLVSGADMILANKRDDQFKRMGLDHNSLKKLNARLIGIQLTGYKGEKTSARDDYPGYDPALQGATGLMERFGPEGCPTFHGVASCVDYLCGYLGAWAGVSALYSREIRQDGQGDWAQSSLAAAASLTQLLLQQTPEPESARGPYATGMNKGERIYKLTDGWIFAQGQSDLTEKLSGFTIEQALSYLKDKNIKAVPVQTCETLAQRHKENPCKTVTFEMRERDGWISENFAPTWLVFDGKPVECPGPAARIGSDAPKILTNLGYSAAEIKQLISANIVGRVEWMPEQK